MTTVREPFPLQFLFSQRVRSMKRVSVAMMKDENAGVWQKPLTLCQEDCFVAAAATAAV